MLGVIEMKNAIINIIERDLKYRMNKNMDPLDICKLFCKHYKSEEYDESELNIRIVTHSSRLLDHMKNIIQYQYRYGNRMIGMRDIEILYTAICFHDIGKVVCKYNHPEYSAIITRYLIDNGYVKFKYIDPSMDDVNRIIESIRSHGDKRNKINDDIIAQILRDVDTLDEVCGEPLVKLALTTLKSNNRKKKPKEMTLNNINYNISDAVIEFHTSNKFINKVISKLNNYISILYYKDQLEFAKELYSETTADTRTDYTISLQEFMSDVQDNQWFEKYLEIIID